MRIVEIKPGRNIINLTKAGEEIEVKGFFEVKNEEQLKIEVIIHHQALHTHAHTLLKGVAWGKSSLKFVGRIIIDPGCQQSSSFLTERILLLSDQAHAVAVPDLEIMTNDVKCSHAVSISNLNQEQLFYLISRGLSRKQAQELIVDGFLGRV